MKRSQLTLLIGMLCLLPLSTFGQEAIDLSVRLRNDKLQAVNRTISLYKDLPGAVEMNAENSDGLGILEGIEFEKGLIEIELLGENNPGKSFIGVAFNIQNDSTFEAVYFRPFNFVAEEQIRKDHMVQYIFHPEFTWRKLREERTGEFEDELPDPPNPDDWFMARIKIMDDSVEVYLEGIPEPVLSVDRLSAARSKKIAIWTGYGSSGRFRNLILTRL